MLNFAFNNVPDVDKYAESIGADGTSILVDPIKMEIICSNIEARERTAYSIVESLMYQMSHQTHFCPDKKQDLIDALVLCGCKQSDFITYGINGKTLSVDKTKILHPLLQRLTDILNKGVPNLNVEDAMLLLTAYLDYKMLSTRSSAANSKLKKLSSETYDGWGQKLRAISFKYEQKETGRFYTYDDSIQNWPLELCNTIAAGKDYFLLWCDFDQIDFRVGYHLYLREPGSVEDKIYLASEDKYRAMYEIICRAARKEPDFELFTKYRKAYKKAILSAMYNASEQSLITDIQNRELGHELYEFFAHNERYQTFRRTIDRIIDFNADIVVSDYFDFQRTIPVTDQNAKAINDVISKCCNTPIQSTSNSILILWLEAVLKKFEQAGYTRGRDVIPYLIRHDECVFMLHKKVIPDLWILADCMSLAIDNWDVLTLEPHCGLYYKEPNEVFEELYKKSIEEHKDKFSPRVINTPRTTIYRPVQEVIDTYVYDTRKPIDIVKSCLLIHPEINLADFAGEDLTSWSEDDALNFLQFAADNLNAGYSKYLKYRNCIILYSNKLQKYRCIPSMEYAVAVAKKIGTNKINCFTIGTSKAFIKDDIMYRIRDEQADKVKYLFDKMDELNFTSDWVSL